LGINYSLLTLLNALARSQCAVSQMLLKSNPYMFPMSAGIDSSD